MHPDRVKAPTAPSAIREMKFFFIGILL
jgi:hypothetical protein